MTVPPNARWQKANTLMDSIAQQNASFPRATSLKGGGIRILQGANLRAFFGPKLDSKTGDAI